MHPGWKIAIWVFLGFLLSWFDHWICIAGYLTCAAMALSIAATAKEFKVCNNRFLK